MKRFSDKSLRHPEWNYDRDAIYMITICTKNKESFFGEITGRKMVLSDIGEIARKCWLDIPKHFPDTFLKDFVIMPDHLHGIVIIDKRIKVYIKTKRQFGPQSRNLGSVIRGFKVGVTIEARKKNPDFAWQARYYDTIISNKESLEKAIRYIRDNPIKWAEKHK